jgi:hypothetical protein
VEDLGSQDLGGVVKNLASDGQFSLKVSESEDSGKLDYNHSIAGQLLGEALLARLLIFYMFLDIAKESGLTEEHKSKWLILQLIPRLGHELDIFDSLACLLREYEVQQDISQTWKGIREILGSDVRPFLVLDEGQTAATDSRDSFPCAFNSEPGKYPLLLKILDTWDDHLPADSFSCVIAGTNIPKHIFQVPKYANQIHWTSDTGSFDDPLRHERYLRRFLPPSLLATQLGREFLQRAWAWTRGR